MRLANKIAIITGGGSGIGQASAEAFCREGANVVLFGRRKQKLEETAKKLGSQALVVQGDMTRGEDLDRLVQETQSKFHRIDILVNNAGLFKGAPLHEITDDQYDEMMDVNMKSAFKLTRRVLPIMMKQKGGSIIHISSILGIIAVPQVAAYNISKGALNQFSRSIAVEYGSYSIRSNAICPGLIETDMTAELMNDEALMQEWSKDYPIGRFGKPQDVANACLFLASDESSFITGTVFPVDGGFTAH
ncbi:MAG: SDR family oxidoreductase [Nitrospina sp.]|jgi:meso-butanediol dehydrogenase / (S,S)-butanediol dehydrogenase / diacetyl reductase|nr:SDR family oxidoreductase [Nitrospina sp.]MBT5631911.1 SDR family oxidoreductase [Nitrospina sp.]